MWFSIHLGMLVVLLWNIARCMGFAYRTCTFKASLCMCGLLGYVAGLYIGELLSLATVLSTSATDGL